MSKSIIQKNTDKLNRECFLCRMENPYAELTHKGLEKHHFMHGNANRKLAERYGLWGYLCPYHHQDSPKSVHKCHETDLILMQTAQDSFESLYGHKQWMTIFGKNYL